MIIPLLFLLLPFYAGLAQTTFSGGIYNDVTWTQANSPYIINGNVVVFPGNTLTIEPGVEVRFDGPYEIEARGILMAIGNASDSIRFTSNSVNPGSSRWSQLDIKNATQGANGYFQYCVFEYADYAVSVECCWTSGVFDSYIKNSTFRNDSVGSNGYAGNILEIRECKFEDNYIGINNADKDIYNCEFYRNTIGIYCERFNVYNSVFINNDKAIYFDQYQATQGVIDSCYFTLNDIGIQIDGLTITNNEIMNNRIGVILEHTPTTVNNNPYYIPVKHNKICRNTDYNAVNGNDQNKDITENCFCSDDSTTIENLLFDGYDGMYPTDSTYRGLFNYDIYDTLCNNRLSSVYKVGGSSPSAINEISIDHNLYFYPNPVESNLYIESNSKEYRLTIFDINGKLIRNSFFNSSNVNLDLSWLEEGIYLIQYSTDTVSEMYRLIKN